MSLTDNVVMPGLHYKAICDAVRLKTGDTALLKSGEIAPLIRSLSSGAPNLIPGDTPVKVSLDIGGNYQNTMQDMGISIVVPITGTYRIKCFVRHGYTSETAWGKSFSAQFYKNDVAVGDIFTIPVGTGVWISIDLDCSARDEIRVRGLAAANSNSYYLIANSLMLCIDWSNNFTINVTPSTQSISINGTASNATISVLYGNNTYTSGNSFKINSGDSISVSINSTSAKKHIYKLNGVSVQETASSTSTSYTYTPTGHATIEFGYETLADYICNLID